MGNGVQFLRRVCVTRMFIPRPQERTVIIMIADRALRGRIALTGHTFIAERWVRSRGFEGRVRVPVVVWEEGSTRREFLSAIDTGARSSASSAASASFDAPSHRCSGAASAQRRSKYQMELCAPSGKPTTGVGRGTQKMMRWARPSRTASGGMHGLSLVGSPTKR